MPYKPTNKLPEGRYLHLRCRVPVPCVLLRAPDPLEACGAALNTAEAAGAAFLAEKIRADIAKAEG